MDHSLSTSSFKMRYLKLTALLLLLIISFDFIAGFLLSKEHKTIDQGEYGVINKMLYTAEEDLIIFGSSRAKFHYDSLLIESQTGMSCYNAGLNGRGFLLSSTLIKQMLKRHKPSVIVLDINFLNKSYKDEQAKISVLRPYYSEHSTVKNMLDFKAPLEEIRHLSFSYPFNATVPAMIEKKIDKSGGDKLKGFQKLSGTKLKKPLEEQVESDVLLDQDLLNELYEVSDHCLKAKVKLIVCLSPSLMNYNKDSIKVIKNGLEQKGIHFYDFTSLKFFQSPKLFHDYQHLNSFGAVLYSQKIAQIVKDIRED